MITNISPYMDFYTNVNPWCEVPCFSCIQITQGSKSNHRIPFTLWLANYSQKNINSEAATNFLAIVMFYVLVFLETLGLGLEAGREEREKHLKVVMLKWTYMSLWRRCTMVTL